MITKIGKKAQEMQFSWLFALIIGAAILFLAVFFSGKLLETGTYQTEAEMARSIDILLNPFASIRQATITLSKPITLPEKTNISFKCDEINNLQKISILLEKGKKPFTYSIKNKYIFGSDFYAKDIWVFGKPFEMPWRVDDFIYVVSGNYCFVNAPNNIKAELGTLNSSKIKIVNEKCTNAINVCFSGACDVPVTYNNGKGYVWTKEGNLEFIDDATMYGAVFGQDVYKCNLNRILKRMEIQASIMIGKSDLLGCSNIKSDLLGLKSSAATKSYANIIDYAERIKSENSISCPIY